MDSSKPSTEPTGSSVPPPEQPKASTAPAPKPKPKGYTNPALQAMGIPRLRLPSRNWMIFWCVVGGVSGLIVYDRRQRQARRQFWKDQVAPFSQVPLDAMELPRKVTVYMAPPPNDYLDVSQKHFRQYIKPILTSAAVDYQVVSETRQGEIRAKVAEEIRNKRRAKRGLPTSDADENNFKDEVDLQIERGINRDKTGGVLCIGRGAYKEYINGLQEGWLGPLEPPKEILEAEKNNDKVKGISVESLDAATTSETTQSTDTPHQVISSEIPQAATTSKEQEEASMFPNEEADQRDVLGYSDEKKAPEGESTEEKPAEEAEKDKRPPVPKPYILGMNRGAKVWGSELPEGADADLLAATPEEVSDPIAVLEFRNLLGFTTIPTRIMRFFSRRELSDKLGKDTAVVVFNEYRPFRNEVDENSVFMSETDDFSNSNDSAARTSDVDALINEELKDWPSKFKQKAIDNNSEWMWPFSVDPRLSSKLRIYSPTPALLQKFEEAKNSKGEKKVEVIEDKPSNKDVD